MSRTVSIMPLRMNLPLSYTQRIISIIGKMNVISEGVRRERMSSQVCEKMLWWYKSCPHPSYKPAPEVDARTWYSFCSLVHTEQGRLVGANLIPCLIKWDVINCCRLYRVKRTGEKHESTSKITVKCSA